MFVGLLQGTLAWQANQSSSSRICSFGTRCVPGSPLERTNTFSPAPFRPRLSAGSSKEEAQGRADLTLLPALPSSFCVAHCSAKRPRSCHHSVDAVGDLDIDWPLMLRCWLMFFLFMVARAISATERGGTVSQGILLRRLPWAQLAIVDSAKSVFRETGARSSVPRQSLPRTSAPRRSLLLTLLMQDALWQK